ncbi:MAG TPA: S41 family peptidase [Allosphingosinicella sp.]|jgi:hypothetical protein
MRRALSLFVAAGALAGQSLAEVASIPIPNPGFEEGAPGAPPPGWGGTVRPGAGPGGRISVYRAVVDAERPSRGRSSVRLEPASDALDAQSFGTVTNSIEASAYRGRRIRLTAAVRAEAPPAAHVGLWLRVDRAQSRMGFFDNMSDRPIRSDDWADYSIEGDVAPDAERIAFGLLLAGPGRVWLDEVRLADVGPASPAPPTDSELNPERYLAAAIGLLRNNHINSGSANWPRLAAEAQAAVAGSTGLAAAHEAIRGLLRALDEPHSFLRPPPGAAGAGLPPVTMATHERIDGRYGLVALPGFLGSPEEAKRYSATLREALGAMDAEGVCGWIVDLRDNGGGNMWPMLNGLDPLLGEAPFGAFRRPSGQLAGWVRSGGEIRVGPEGPAERPAFALRHASAPVAVLIGPRTASSGEMTAIAFAGRPGARSFGAPSRGFTTSNSIFPLPDGALLVITTAFVRDRTGRDYRGPIQPDQPTVYALAAAKAWLGSKPCRLRRARTSR